MSDVEKRRRWLLVHEETHHYFHMKLRKYVAVVTAWTLGPVPMYCMRVMDRDEDVAFCEYWWRLGRMKW